MTNRIVLGRDPSCDVTITEPTVSSHHARMTWEGVQILLEDLNSANGTFVDGERVSSKHVAPGDTVHFGDVELEWGDPLMRDFLRKGASGTLVATSLPKRRFVCGNCGTRGELPVGFTQGVVSCGACGKHLAAGPPPARRRRESSAGVMLGTFLCLALLVVGGLFLVKPELFEAARRVELRPPPSSRAELIERTSGEQVRDAIDTDSPITRNTAVRIASQTDGPFSVEQVARIWNHVKGRWRYVNDPRGREYFATASETIENEYVGDCDDFAIVLAAMIEAIGGRARLVMMDSESGGHAYTEACIQMPPEEVRSRLARHYRRTRDRNHRRQRVTELNYRVTPECPTWLNLDWNARVPGGAYETESWAVSVYSDGRTETLVPAGTQPDESVTNPAD